MEYTMADLESGRSLGQQALDNLLAMLDGTTTMRLVTGSPVPVPAAGEGREFFLLVCRSCGDGDLVMPFGSQEERGRWAGAHTRGTGHERWFVADTRSLLADGLSDRPADVLTAMARTDEILRKLTSGELP